MRSLCSCGLLVTRLHLPWKPSPHPLCRSRALTFPTSRVVFLSGLDLQERQPRLHVIHKAERNTSVLGPQGELKAKPLLAPEDGPSCPQRCACVHPKVFGFSAQTPFRQTCFLSTPRTRTVTVLSSPPFRLIPLEAPPGSRPVFSPLCMVSLREERTRVGAAPSPRSSPGPCGDLHVCSEGRAYVGQTQEGQAAQGSVGR